MAQRTIAVVGMHRSGTSCLTGTLEEAGLYLGDVSRKNPHNLKGNHERADIMQLHDAVLAANGGAWDQPPATTTWPQERQQELEQIIEGYADRPLWGFKDPRTLLVLDGWVSALPELEFAGIFRHPLMVAQSLHKRGRMTIEDGLSLWQTYNQNLLELHRIRAFPLIEFVPAPGAFRRSLSRLLSALGLDVEPERLEFYAPELQHQTDALTAQPLPAEVEAVFRTLQARSL